jgi:hypothetical protein
MPEPYSLERHVAGGETFVTRGPYVVSRFDSDDIGMRNLRPPEVALSGGR